MSEDKGNKLHGSFHMLFKEMEIKVMRNKSFGLKLETKRWYILNQGIAYEHSNLKEIMFRKRSGPEKHSCKDNLEFIC